MAFGMRATIPKARQEKLLRRCMRRMRYVPPLELAAVLRLREYDVQLDVFHVVRHTTPT
jgi:hypothetical protein